MKWGRIILAIVAGEILLILLTTLVQEVIFDGISFNSSSGSELIIGGGGTFLAAVIAGFATALIARDRSYIPPLVISLLIILESSWLISTGVTADPLWFDIAAAASLVAGIWIGAFIYWKRGSFISRADFRAPGNDWQ